jgi:hypothetical protein
MKEKLVTIVVLPYSKAQMLKVRLEEQEIECELEDINLMEDAAASVKSKILDKDIWNAMPILEGVFGEKPELQKQGEQQRMTIFLFRLISRRFHSVPVNWPLILPLICR